MALRREDEARTSSRGLRSITTRYPGFGSRFVSGYTAPVAPADSSTAAAPTTGALRGAGNPLLRIYANDQGGRGGNFQPGAGKQYRDMDPMELATEINNRQEMGSVPVRGGLAVASAAGVPTGLLYGAAKGINALTDSDVRSATRTTWGKPADRKELTDNLSEGGQSFADDVSSNMATESSYGTNRGSEQTEMLRDQDAGLYSRQETDAAATYNTKLGSEQTEQLAAQDSGFIDRGEGSYAGAPTGGEASPTTAPGAPDAMDTSTMSWNDSGGNDSDSGDAGGGCVVTTQLVDSGLMPSRMKLDYLAFCRKTKHGSWAGEAQRRGYKLWGIRAVRMMRRSQTVSNVMHWIARSYHAEIKRRMGRGPFNLAGFAVAAVLEPASFLLGLLIREPDWKSLYRGEKK